MVGVSSALYPRVAGGDGELTARSCRVTMAVITISSLLLAATTPVVVPFAFGSGFEEAVPMVLLLLLASVPLAAAVVLGSALGAAGNPGAAMRAELAGLAVTVPALVLLLPSHGGRAAALISLIAYSVRVALQVRSARRTFDMPWWSFLLPTWADIRWLLSRRDLATPPAATGPPPPIQVSDRL